MKVLLLSRYGNLGASSRIRSYQYIPFLKSQGIEVTVAPLLEDSYIKNLYTGKAKNFSAIVAAYLRRIGHLLKSRRFDLLWIEKEIFPWLPAWGEILLGYSGIPYIVDYDDAIFHRYDMNSNTIVRSFLGQKIDVVMKHAAVVVAGNEYLGDRAVRAGAKRVEYIPTVIDLNRYNPIDKENNIFTVGWIGSPTTAKYLQLIREPLAEVCRNSKSRIVLVGSGDIEFKEASFVVESWSEETEVSSIQRFDIGVMPLTDEPWEWGKCGYKLIQYMACGLPVIASPVGVNQKIVEHGINGFLAETPEKWVRALRSLRDNVDLRERMGKAGRIKVESQYCVQVTAPRLEALFRSVVRK